MRELSTRELERVAYGAAHEIIRQCLDNGELTVVDFQEFLPSGERPDSPEEHERFVELLQQVIEGIVQSDLWEQQAKRDG